MDTVIPAQVGMTLLTICHLPESSTSTRRLELTRSPARHPCASRGPEKPPSKTGFPLSRERRFGYFGRKQPSSFINLDFHFAVAP